MAVRKTVEEAFIVDGPREEWIDRCVAALTAAGFTGVAPNATLGQVSGNYKKLTVWGELALTLKPEGSNQTEIAASATANVDNIFALFGSPGRKIIQQFKSGLSAAA